MKFASKQNKSWMNTKRQELTRKYDEKILKYYQNKIWLQTRNTKRLLTRKYDDKQWRVEEGSRRLGRGWSKIIKKNTLYLYIFFFAQEYFISLLPEKRILYFFIAREHKLYFFIARKRILYFFFAREPKLLWNKNMIFRKRFNPNKLFD